MFSNIFFLPVSNPAITPKIEPRESPITSLHKLSRRSENNVPDVIISQRAAATLEGGGKRAILTIPLCEIISHNTRAKIIGSINHRNFFIHNYISTTEGDIFFNGASKITSRKFGITVSFVTLAVSCAHFASRFQ